MVDVSKNKDDAMTLWQLFAILEGVIVGVGVLSMARTLSHFAGRSAWLSVLLAGSSVLPFLWFYKALAVRFPGYTLIEYADLVLGKWLGKTISFIFIGMELFLLSLFLRTMADFISVWFLPNTAVEGIMIITLMLAVYMVVGGIKVVARTSEVVLFFLIPFLLLLMLPFRRIDPANIRPLLDTNFMGIFKGMLPALYNLMGIETLYMISAFVNQKEQIFKVAGLSVGINTALYVMVVISNIGVLGLDAIKYLNYPLIYYIKNERFPFFERVDLFFAFFWTFAIFIAIGIVFYSVTLAVSQFFNLQPRYGKYSASLIAVAAFFLAKMPQNTADINRYVDIIMYIALPMVLLLPAVLFLVAIIRKVKPKGDGA